MCRHSPRIAERSDGQCIRWLAKPLLQSGDSRGAVEALTESFEIASNLSLRPEMLQTAFYLKDIAVDCEDLRLAEDWMPIWEDLDRDIHHGYSRAANALYLRARIALMNGDLRESRALLIRAQGISGTIGVMRAEESILALELLLRLRIEGEVARRSVNKLRRLHGITRHSGFRDFEAGALIHALAHLGEAEAARTLAQDYVCLRRSRLPFHSVFATARQRL